MVRQVILKIEGTSFTLRVFTQQCARKGGKKRDGGNPHNDAFKPIFFIENFLQFILFERHFIN